MARMLGIHASIIRGSVGGNTFTANRNHQIVIRQRTAPVQPNTTFQAQVKSAFAAAVVAWETATPVARQQWNAYAQTVTLQGPLGPYQPSGRDLAIAQYAYTQWMQNIAGISPLGGASMLAPSSAGQLAMTFLAVQPLTSPGTGFEVVAYNMNGEDVYFGGSRSLKCASSRNYWSGPFDPSTADVQTVADAAQGTIAFDSLEDEGVYFVRVRMISQSAGRRLSGNFIVRAIASVTSP